MESTELASKTDRSIARGIRWNSNWRLSGWSRAVKGGQEASVTARVLGVPKQTWSNWVRLGAKGELQGAGERPVSAEQMELARLRSELAQVKMERDILKKRRRTSQRVCCGGTPGSPSTS